MDLLPWKRNIILIIFWILANPETALNAASVIAVEDQICQSLTCNETSETLSTYMNQNADPCDNFFEFACGGYVKTKEIPQGASEITIYSEISVELQQRMKDVIETEIDYGSIRPFRLLKDYYNLCMDTATIDKKSKDELLEILKSFGGWPVLDESWDESAFDWKKFAFISKKLGYPVDTFIDFQIVADHKDESKNMISVNGPPLLLPRRILKEGINETSVQAYLNFAIVIAQILGAKPDKAKAEITEAMEFLIELTKISAADHTHNNTSKYQNLISLQDLKSNYTIIPWEDYLNELLAPLAKLQPDEMIWIDVPSYLEKLPALMQKTPKRVIANYGVWRMVQESLVTLGEEVQNANQEYRKALEGVQDREERWKFCMGKLIQDSDGYLGHFHIAAGALYVKKYFNESSKHEVTKIIDNVRESFQELINGVKWMDEETKKIASKKLQSIKTFIGYPDEMLDSYLLEEYYKDLELDTSSFLRSELSLLKYQLIREIDTLRKPNKKNDWRNHGFSAIVNGLYIPIDNTIEITAGFLQGHFFDKDRPKYMNYGSVGWIVGHEMTHALDKIGRKIDENGNKKDWWSNDTLNKYDKLAGYIEHQYNQQYITLEINKRPLNVSINGHITLGENIADIGGIEEAYLAYMKWEEKNGVEPKLPNLPYNPRQLFWISAATSHCVKANRESIITEIFTGVHAPLEVRVIGTLSNMIAFSKDFKCPENSRMNPKEKYSIWSNYQDNGQPISSVGKKDLLLFALFLGLMI